MKLTSRRFGRSTAHEDVDEGMGGGDYPTVVHDQPIVLPDLSVEPPLQVIPEQQYPELTADPEVPAYGSEQDFWGSVGNAPDKTARRRTRRGIRSLGVVDYPSVGPEVDAAPVVIPDLSVEHDLQIIPGPADPAISLTKQPPRDGGTDFWTEVGAEPEKAPRPWWRRRTTWITATILFTVVAVALSLIAISGPAVKNKRISYTFPVEAFPQTGVTVSRVWTLYGGAHPSLHGDLTFYSSRQDSVSVEELLPQSLVKNASGVTFIPQPQHVSSDPVVASYLISSAASGVTAVEYNIPLQTGTKYDLTSLHTWATDQAAEQGKRYLASHTLASIHLTPPSIVVKKDGPAYQLAISGLLNDQSAAPTIAFGTATWSVENPKIAKVSSKGQVTGLNVGRTTVRATVGKLSATATVTVSAAAKVKTTPPLKPLLAGGLSGDGPGTISSSIGPISDPTNPATNPPVKTPVVHNPPPTHNPPPVIPPPPVCPPAPPAPSGVSVFATSYTSVEVTWAAPTVPAGCGFALAGYSVTGSATATTSATSVEFTGLPFGATVSYAVTASYGAQNSAAVGSAPFTLTVPQCDTTTETPPALLSAAGNPAVPGEITVSWSAAGAAPPCAVTGYSVVVDGAAVQSGLTGTSTVIDGLTGGVSHTVSVTASFSAGTPLSSAVGSAEPFVLCSDGTTIAQDATGCPVVPPPPPPI